VNVNTIEFSMIPQSSVNGDTPPTPDCMPMFCGDPPNTASMCGVLPGSTSVTVTSQRENMSFMQVTVAVQVAALVFHAGTVEVELMIDERFVRESSSPG
jgi:hypothetical protein